MQNHMKKIGRLTILGWLLALMSIGNFSHAAADSEPARIIESTVQELLTEFTARRAELQNNRSALYQMVDKITRPHFDFDRISKLVLAQEWKAATEAQRVAFGDEFRTLLIRTYATALFQYTGNEKVVISGSEIKERRGTKTASINTEVRLSDGPPIPVGYSMLQEKDGSWKIYNMVIAGVNMVTSYRKTYSTSVRSLGLDGLIESMRKANAQSA